MTGSPTAPRERLTESERARGVALRPFPSVTLQILSRSADEDADPRELVQLARTDAVLTARMLQLVNSSAFGLRQRIVRLGDAAMLLGSRGLAQLAVTSAAALQHVAAGFLDEDSARFLWRRSLGTAIAARALLPDERFAERDRIFLLGLFQGLGHLDTYQRLPRRFRLAIGQRVAAGIDRFAAEEQVLGCHFLARSARLCSEFGLPEDLCAPLRGDRGSEPLASVLAGERQLAELLDPLGLVDADDRWTLPLPSVRPSAFLPPILDPRLRELAEVLAGNRRRE
jgi:HD-like signal output (HDOD) protein